MLVEPRWLGATAAPSSDVVLAPALLALCDVFPQLRVVVNIFDGAQPRAAQYNSSSIELTFVTGLKSIFWKRVLTPARVRSFEVVWLFDADIAVHPSVFPLATSVSVLAETGASILQPAIRGWGLATHHGWLQHRWTHLSCAVTTARFVEIMTPLFRKAAWSAFHEAVLTRMPDKRLATLDYCLDLVWCAAVATFRPRAPACVVTPGDAAMHRHTKTIKRGVDRRPESSANAADGENSCGTLEKLFPQWWKNYSHDTKACWHIDAHGRLHPNRGSGFWFEAQERTGLVRAMTWGAQRARLNSSRKVKS